MRNRVCAIVMSGDRFMFMGQTVYGIIRRVFAGGGVEEGETMEEAALRELNEEAGVTGTVLFGPAAVRTERFLERVFVIDIGCQEPSLGRDPELPADCQQLKGVVRADLSRDAAIFNAYDMIYVSAVLDHADLRRAGAPWIDKLREAAGRPYAEREI